MIPESWFWAYVDVRLTGRRRVRRQRWTGALILQVELTGMLQRQNSTLRRAARPWWRDATLDDLLPASADGPLLLLSQVAP